MHKLTIKKGDQTFNFNVPNGKNLLEFLNENSFYINSPCGGKGICGKCRVKIKDEQKKPLEKELMLLGSDYIQKGFRLACYYDIDKDIEVEVLELENEAQIAVDGVIKPFTLNNPVVSKKEIQFDEPDLNDQRSDLKRLLDHLGHPAISLKLLRKLPELIRENNFKATYTLYRYNKLLDIESRSLQKPYYAIAVDIGTTTVAAYLLDLYEGKCIDTYATLNPQRKYGADVVSRINYSDQSSDNLNSMHKAIIDCINNDIIGHFLNHSNVVSNDIYSIAIVGNTTMLHFIMNISPHNIALTPFISATTELHEFDAKELGININEHGMAIVLPSVSAYIGADTVSAVLASGMIDKDEISLMVDLGTNGEIVLGNRQQLFSCSTAAGPAFEGAQIRNGMGGVTGAIDSFRISSGTIYYTTIGDKKPIGICGSGLVDIAAELLEVGVIDETGRVQEDQNSSFNKHTKKIDGLNSFVLVNAEDSGNKSVLAITQKDIRELQNAKAAVTAGIKVLIKRAGIEIDDIKKVYFAGGFGNYINIQSAVKIGLIPKALEDRVEPIGNAAGAGAILLQMNTANIDKALEICKKIEYIELSASIEFMDEYIECMTFGLL